MKPIDIKFPIKTEALEPALFASAYYLPEAQNSSIFAQNTLQIMSTIIVLDNKITIRAQLLALSELYQKIL